MIIALLGYMGSGKSSIGRRLAAKIDWPLIDLDDYIVEQEGRSIVDIFATDGEAYFRELEKKCLQQIIKNNRNIVLALGGGTPCRQENWKHIEQTTSIYLYKTPKALYHNLKEKKTKRPLIRDMKNNELKEYVKIKLEERHPHYSRANHTLDTHKPKKKVAKEIIKLLGLRTIKKEEAVTI